jgi:hypothetical protein
MSIEPGRHGVDAKLDASISIHPVLGSSGFVVQHLNAPALQTVDAVDTTVNDYLLNSKTKFPLGAENVRFGLECAQSDELPQLLSALALIQFSLQRFLDLRQFELSQKNLDTLFRSALDSAQRSIVEVL